MQDQVIRPPSEGLEIDRGLEATIVSVLGGGDDPIWLLDELEREIGESHVSFANAIGSLQCAGVVRISGEFIKLSRAARHTYEL